MLYPCVTVSDVVLDRMRSLIVRFLDCSERESHVRFGDETHRGYKRKRF